MSAPTRLSAFCSDPWARAVATGVLLSLAFPCHPQHPLAAAYGAPWAWIALVPLLLAVADSARAGTAFRQAWVAGFVFHLLGLYWVAHTRGGGPAVVGGTALMAAYLALFTALFGAATAFLVRRHGVAGLLGAPVLWTAVEYLLSLGELGFPWLLLGHSQAPLPAVVQYAEYTGVYGVSFAVALANSLLALGLCRRGGERWPALAGAAVPVLAAAHGGLVMAAGGSVGTDGGADGVRVAVVQNNIGLEKWRPGGLEASFASLEALSRRATPAPDLFVWPETAVPCHLGRRTDCRRRVGALAAELGAPILTGAPDSDADTGEPTNGAFLFPPDDGPVPTYAKMHLVPFGERTPLRDRIPGLRDIDWSVLTGDLGPAEFARGRRRTLFPVGPDSTRFATLICFESVFPDFVRLSVREGADFLVNITNDSWFGDTAGPFQHADLAVLRAVENRIGIARCATSGVSLFIDRYGRTRQRTVLGTADVRVDTVDTRRGATLYTRHGDWFAGTLLALAALLVAGARWAPLPRFPMADERPESAEPAQTAGAARPESAEPAQTAGAARPESTEPAQTAGAARPGADDGSSGGSGAVLAAAGGGRDLTSAGVDGEGDDGDDDDGDGKEMAFLDHLEELRWRILKSLAAIFVGAALCWIYVDPLLGLLVAPYEDAVASLHDRGSSDAADALRGWLEELRGAPVVESPVEDAAPESAAPAVPYRSQLQSLGVMTWFFVYIQVSLLGGFIFALPVVFYQFWRFVAPGLLASEKRLLIPIVTMSVVCFAAGALVAHRIVLPIGLRFFLSLEPENMTSQWAVDQYIGFVLRLLLGFGLVFEMPVVSLFLARLGLITADYLRSIRRYAIVGVFLVAAVFTPPDPLSQILMALPLMVLYELSIWVAALAGRRRPDEDGETGPA